MSYDVTTVTIKGAELLAAASASDKLILAGCDATQTYITKANAILVENRPASPFSNSTNVRLEGSTDSHVFMRIFFVAGQSTGGDVNSLYLYGHKESAPGTEYVIAIMSSQTAFHLPEEGDISNTYGTLLDIVFNVATGSIESVTSSVYATYSEYADLRDRAVTTHKQGEPTVGEDQSIRGKKHFIGAVETEQTIDYVGSDSNSIIRKPLPGFVSDTTLTTQYGASTTKSFTVNGSSKAFYTSSLSFETTDDAHEIVSHVTKDTHKLNLNAYQLNNGGGVSRSFAIESQVLKSSITTTLASVSTHLDRNFVTISSGGGYYTDEQETGRLELMAQEPLHNVSAKVILNTEYPSGNTAYPTSKISISSKELTIEANDEVNIESDIVRFYVGDNSGKTIVVTCNDESLTINNVYSSSLGASLTFSKNVDGDEYSIYPDKKAGTEIINLGLSMTNEFDNVYATTFHGSLSGNASTATSATSASSATNDVNGHALTSYFRGVGSPYGSHIVFKDGTADTETNVPVNDCVSYSVQGKKYPTDSIFSGIGAVGLFCYVGTSESYPFTKMPGDTVSGTELKTAGLGRDETTGDVSIYAQSAGSATYMSGTWVLLSYLYKEDENHTPLVLAVKTSLT